jgi:N utilization substance protein B
MDGESSGRPDAGSEERSGGRVGARGVRSAGRRAARRQALEVLYQADVTGRLPTEVVEEWTELGRVVSGDAASLAEGVQRDRSRIDRLLEEHSEEWAVHRMAVVDRTILRLACLELLVGVPAAIAINEAVVAAHELSTEDSGRFVNGLLGKIARVLAAERAAGP